MSNDIQLEAFLKIMSVNAKDFALMYKSQTILLPDDIIPILVRRLAEYQKERKEEKLQCLKK